MKKKLSKYDIANELIQDENANWSYAGALALAEWLEDYEESTGQEIEFDLVAIRCDFSEYDGLVEWSIAHFGGEKEAAASLGLDVSMAGDLEADDDEIEDTIRSYIEYRATLIEFEGGIIVSSF